MKKIIRYAMTVCLLVLFCTACSKEEPDNVLQTEHVPGTEEAVVNTPTPIPTEGIQPTLPASAEKEEPQISPELEEPTPTPVIEEPEFMTMYRAMPSGIRVNIDGIEEEALGFCFCDLEITNQTRTGFTGQEGLDWLQVRELCGIRVLYYRKDGKPYICDVIANKAECEVIKNCFYTMFLEKQEAENLMTNLPEALTVQGYKAGTLEVGSVQYLYLEK